jgi:hypothetical protein
VNPGQGLIIANRKRQVVWSGFGHSGLGNLVPECSLGTGI